MSGESLNRWNRNTYHGGTESWHQKLTRSCVSDHPITAITRSLEVPIPAIPLPFRAIPAI
jgi:hypothetical protein